jgi:hypothetical protein
MTHLMTKFRYNPLKPLLESDDPAIIYFTRRDILEERVDRSLNCEFTPNPETPNKTA